LLAAIKCVVQLVLGFCGAEQNFSEPLHPFSEVER